MAGEQDDVPDVVAAARAIVSERFPEETARFLENGIRDDEWFELAGLVSTGLPLPELGSDVSTAVMDAVGGAAATSQHIIGLENESVEEGVWKCRDKACGSRRMSTSSHQTRGGDESMTLFITCMKCGKRYKDG